MPRRLFHIAPLLLAAALAPLQAASILCTLQTGPKGPIVTQACDQALSTPTASMSWGTVLSATSGQISGPVYGSIGGDQVTITSYDNLEGAYNAGYAWSSAFDQWLPSGFLVPPGTTTFAGDFNTPTSSGA